MEETDLINQELARSGQDKISVMQDKSEQDVTQASTDGDFNDYKIEADIEQMHREMQELIAAEFQQDNDQSQAY